jgi:hypothetical protein
MRDDRDEMYWADAMCDIVIDCTLQTPSLLCGLVRWERRLIDGLLGMGRANTVHRGFLQ